MATVTRILELSPEAAAELDRRAELEQRAPSDVVSGLLLEDTEVHEDDFSPEQWAHIQKGIAQADAGDFASPERVEAIFARARRVQ